MTTAFRIAALAGASMTILGACSSGGDSTAPVAPPVVVTPPPAAQSDTFVTVSGEITGFGSVIVNGTRYDTDSARVRKNGRDADLSDLSVGQIVAIRAKRNGEGQLPTALRVRYEEVLEGPVEAIATDGRSLTILGQTVFITDGTVFEDDLEFDAIQIDDVLEVSGSFTADGDIVASYVEISDEVDGDYEVHGTVGALDSQAQTFRVKGLKVFYGNAQLDDFDDRTLSNGDKVEVEGSVFQNDGTLIATQVEYEGDDLEEFEDEGENEGDDDDRYEAEVQGFITRFDAPTDFAVGDVDIVTNDATDFERCTADGLALDVEVEVEGVFDDNGVLVADEVECEIEANTFITAEVDEVDEGAGTVTLLGVTLAVNGSTAYQDKSRAKVREFGLDDIAVGDVLRVQAYDAAGEDLPIAKRLRRERDDKFRGPEVKGDLDAIETERLIVAGVTVTYAEDIEFELDEDEVSEAVFFDTVRLGDRLKARGVESEEGTLLADKLSIEDDDDDDEDND